MSALISLIDQRIRFLRHRAESLPAEIEHWISFTAMGSILEKNWSHLQALKIFMDELQTRLRADVDAMESLAKPPATDLNRVLQQIELVDSRIGRSHYVWGYFRNKLEQRFVPHFAGSLLAMDLTSQECYRTVMDKAELLGVQKRQLRDYPLTFFQEEYASPVTWPRNVPESKLDHRTLPIPIVGLPWDHQRSTWEFLSLHHEVSHDIDTDLGDLSSEIATILVSALEEDKVPSERVAIWHKWMPEIFADFLGILLGGPAFVRFLANFLAVTAEYVCGLTEGEHPTPFLRILLNVDFVKALECGEEAVKYMDELSAQWASIYGSTGAGMEGFRADFGTVIRVFLKSPLNLLTDDHGSKHFMTDLVAFTEADYSKQLELSRLFEDGGKL
jgi:hypothetical protein